MILGPNSVLKRIPSALDPKQAFFIEGIRISIEMIDVAHQRLQGLIWKLDEGISKGESNAHDYFIPALLDAWSIIDSIHRLSDLAHDFPHIKHRMRDAGFHYLIKNSEKVNELRNIVQHLPAVADVDELRDAYGSIPFKDFSETRDRCRALREILLPDSIWQQFRDWHSLPDDVAAHRSILLLAFRRGCLSTVTKPIHRYIVSSKGILSGIRKQYIQDFRERWMFADDPVERNRLSKIFRGRLVELQFALWLEGQSQEIVGLEATRKGPDIETRSTDGAHNSFEVKFISVEDGDFRIFVESIAGLPAATSVSPYTAMNYLVFRVYEAARQLGDATGTKKVVVVVDDLTWFRFEMQLTENWIKWNNPAFISPDSEWTQFLDEQRKRYPDLPSDLATTIQEIDSIKIFRQSSRFEFILEYDLSLRPQL